jgi:endonuclease/exonuclease/phosphatase family metal-dependent hydrolase
MLKPFAADIQLRMDNYNRKKNELLAGGTTLKDFANGHEYFGFHKSTGDLDGWFYREWAPAAEEVYLTGDFNEEQVSAIFNALTLENARKKAPLTDNFATSNGWGSKNQQIDHIFYGNLEVLSYETIRDRWEGYTYISDHYPVMSTFNFNK